MKVTAFRILGGLSVALTLLTTGCVTAKRAYPIAAQRSGCAPAKIDTIKQDGSDAVLDVCGVREDWRHHAFKGWQYVGASAEQPLATPDDLDPDKDGIESAVDACPREPGTQNDDPALNGCPLPTDTDGDGVSDDVDACPTTAGVKEPGSATSGCPPDSDGDKVPDTEDACPKVAGLKSTTAAKNGCPSDADGDGVPDADDHCPNEAGQRSTEAGANGCPVQTPAEEP